MLFSYLQLLDYSFIAIHYVIVPEISNVDVLHKEYTEHTAYIKCIKNCVFITAASGDYEPYVISDVITTCHVTILIAFYINLAF